MRAAENLALAGCSPAPDAPRASRRTQPVFTRQVRLWDVHGAGLLQGGTGKGTFAGASSPAQPGSFGPVPLAPVIVRLRPGRRLLVWMWSWQISNRVEGTLAFLSMHVPAVNLCASPPLVLH